MSLDLYVLHTKGTQHTLILRVGENGASTPRLNTTSAMSLSFFFITHFCHPHRLLGHVAAWVETNQFVLLCYLFSYFGSVISTINEAVAEKGGLCDTQREGRRVTGRVSATFVGGFSPGGASPRLPIGPRHGPADTTEKATPHFTFLSHHLLMKPDTLLGVALRFPQHQLADKKNKVFMFLCLMKSSTLPFPGLIIKTTERSHSSC